MKSYGWLKFGDVKGETESETVTAKDQAISTNHSKNKILKEETDCKCQLCKQREETTDHLTSGCPIVVKNEYLMRRDKVCANLQYSICKALDRQMVHTHSPKPVCEHEDVKLLWNQGVHTEKLQQNS
jgi:hypothetical protein